MKWLLSRSVFFLILCLALPSQADFNLINVDVGSPEGQRLTNLYGNAYGFTPQEVAPAMMAPAQEVPGILQLAKAAGTIPLTVWMMRKLGMSYGDIASSYALGPASFAGYPAGGGGFTDATYVQSTQNYFLGNMLQVPNKILPSVPLTGIAFSQAILNPYDPVNGFWLPPGIAKKYGVWVIPTQVNTLGWVPVQEQKVKVYHHKKWKGKKWKHKKGKHKGWH